MKFSLLYLTFSIFAYNSFAQYQKKFIISREDSLQLDSTWNVFKKAVLLNDKAKVTELSMDTVMCRVCVPMPKTAKEMERKGWNHIIPVKKFIKEMNHVFSGDVWKAINSKRYKVFATEFLTWKPENWNSKEDGNYIVYEIGIRTHEQDELGKGHEGRTQFFRFVKLKGKFMFEGVTSMP